MRLCLPIGAPLTPGSNSYSLVSATGTYSLVGKAANLLPTLGSTMINPFTLDATNTGAILAPLTNTSVNSISTPGTYQNLRFTGGLEVIPGLANKDAYYLFRNCYFENGNYYNTCLIPDNQGYIPTNIHFEYCTFDAGGVDKINGLTGAFATATRCWFKGFNNCIQIYDPCSIIECANDGLMTDIANGGHFDCVENNGAPNIIITSCKWVNPFGQTSALMMNNEFGDIYNVTVTNCYLEGGGYTVYTEQKDPSRRMDTVRFINCTLKRGFYGYIADNSPTGTYMPETGPDANLLI